MKKTLRKTADDLWAEAIKLRDGYHCQIPGCKREPVFAHHLFSRTFNSVRFILRNGITLCFHHHSQVHSKPELFREFLIEFCGGQKEWDNLKFRAKSIVLKLRDFEYGLIIAELKETIKGLSEDARN